MTNPLEPVTPVSHHRPSAAKASAPPCRYNDTVSRLAPRPRVSATVGAALGALVLACAAPSAIAAEPPPPPPPAAQGLDLQLLNLLRITLNPNSVHGQTNVPLNIHLTVPSVLDLKVETGLGVTTPPGPGTNVGVQVPLAVDLTTPVGGVNLDVNANVDASLLNGQDLVDASATVDVNAEACLLGLNTELGANVGADVNLGPNPALDLRTDLRLPPELERIIEPAGSPAAKPLPVGNQTATPPVVQQPPVVEPTPPTPSPPTPPTAGPEPTPPIIDPTPPKPPVAVPPTVAEIPVVEVPTIQPSSLPLERLRDVAVAAGRSIWLPLGLMMALFAYLLGQRLLDGGAKLASAARSATPDDEIIEL